MSLFSCSWQNGLRGRLSVDLINRNGAVTDSSDIVSIMTYLPYITRLGSAKTELLASSKQNIAESPSKQVLQSLLIPLPGSVHLTQPDARQFPAGTLPLRPR